MSLAERVSGVTGRQGFFVPIGDVENRLASRSNMASVS